VNEDIRAMQQSSDSSTLLNPGILPRLVRAITFVAIVWSIAISFLLLESGGQHFVEWAIKNNLIPIDLAMPTASPEALAECVAAPQARPSTTGASQNPAARQQARFNTWEMGYRFGYAVGLAHAGLTEQSQWAELLARVASTGEALRVPSPSAPPFGPSATALLDFAQWVEDDRSCTAFQLERVYDSSFGHLFKLGAVVGHATIYRAACPECGAQFVPQIQHHGREARLPTEAWKPYTEKPALGLSPDDRRERDMTLLQNLQEFIKRAE
jgi:hypothetical protein